MACSSPSFFWVSIALIAFLVVVIYKMRGTPWVLTLVAWKSTPYQTLLGILIPFWLYSLVQFLADKLTYHSQL